MYTPMYSYVYTDFTSWFDYLIHSRTQGVVVRVPNLLAGHLVSVTNETEHQYGSLKAMTNITDLTRHQPLIWRTGGSDSTSEPRILQSSLN